MLRRLAIPGIHGDDLHFGAGVPPERSLWLQEALAGEHDQPALQGPARADVCIVGGGYTGLWTALRLKELEPGLEVTVVEADICGGGPSGRNGGFMDPWSVKFFALAELCGTEEALRLCRMSSDAIEAVDAFCQENSIDAHIRRKGGVWTAATPDGVGSWRSTVETLSSHGHDSFREVNTGELRDLTGTDVYLAGVFDSEQATVQPALLARGMRRVALDRGITIYEHSPITRLDRSPRATVHTADGSVTTERVVLAMGAWLGQIHELRNHFAVVATDMVATEPIPELLGHSGLAQGVGISDSRVMINYYRSTHDGRIAWGKGGVGLAYGARVGRSLHGVSPRPQVIVDSLKRHYPDLADVRITHSWTGPVDRSIMGVPFFARLPGHHNIVYGGGYSGNGVVPSYVGGHILASLTLDRDDEHSQAGLVRHPFGDFPPEPARYIGGLLVRSALDRVEQAHDQGRPPSRVAMALQKLAPPGPSEPRPGASSGHDTNDS